LSGPVEISNRHGAALATFNSSDFGRAELRLTGEITLAPSTTDAKRANGSTEANEVHGAMVSVGAYQALCP
jgi:hypothetical protein